MSKSQTKNDKNEVVLTMSIEQLRSRAEKAKALFAQLEDLLPGLVTMTEDDRRHSEGKMRVGEAEALASVIDVAEQHPQYFAVLADKDRGVDPKRFETELLRDHLARREILSSVLAAAEPITAPLSDTVLTLGEAVRPALLAAYQIAKPISTSDDQLRSALAPALDFYGRIGRRSAEARAKKSDQSPK